MEKLSCKNNNATNKVETYVVNNHIPTSSIKEIKLVSTENPWLNFDMPSDTHRQYWRLIRNYQATKINYIVTIKASEFKALDFITADEIELSYPYHFYNNRHGDVKSDSPCKSMREVCAYAKNAYLDGDQIFNNMLNNGTTYNLEMLNMLIDEKLNEYNGSRSREEIIDEIRAEFKRITDTMKGIDLLCYYTITIVLDKNYVHNLDLSNLKKTDQGYEYYGGTTLKYATIVID